MSEPSEVWNEVFMYGGALLAGVALFALKGVRNLVVDWWKRATKKQAYCPDLKDFRADRNIHEILTELRTVVKADRSCVFQFHNGNIFSSMQPIWRLSCTHESCGAGVSHEIANRQAIMASSMGSILNVVFLNADLNELTFIKPFPAVKPFCFTFKVKDLYQSFFKSMLTIGGAEAVCIIPITKNGNLIGFINLCYLEADGLDNTDFSFLPEYVSRIIFELERRK